MLCLKRKDPQPNQTLRYLGGCTIFANPGYRTSRVQTFVLKSEYFYPHDFSCVESTFPSLITKRDAPSSSSPFENLMMMPTPLNRKCFSSNHIRANDDHSEQSWMIFYVKSESFLIFLDCFHLYCSYLLSNAIHNFSFKNISFANLSMVNIFLTMPILF